MYPSRESIDAWKELGNEGWDYDSFAPYLHKFSTVHPAPQATKDVVGLEHHDEKNIGTGPVQVSYGDGYNEVHKTWVKAFENLGLKPKHDGRSGQIVGGYQSPATIDPKTKSRSYAVTAHYTPEIAARKNLTVLTETRVKKITFDTSGPEPVATGVLARANDGTEREIKGSEVIVSGGAFMSPQILELSGVGGKDLLEKHGIPVVIDNPAVGENLQDHPLVSQCFEVRDDVPTAKAMADPNVMQALMQQYQTERAGPLGMSAMASAYVPITDATSVCSQEAKEAFLAANSQHIKTSDDKLIQRLLEKNNEPSVQYQVAPNFIDTTIQEPQSLAECIAAQTTKNYINFTTMLAHPFSRGSVHIASADVNDKPTWDPNFNSNPLDLELAARHVQFIDRLISTPPFTDLVVQGGARWPDIKADTLEGAKDIVRKSELSCFHPAGTCTMRPKDQGGVVDSRLRLHGAKGVRVVDASIIPLEPLGNIQTVVYALAERAADMIKEERKAKA